MKMAKLLIAGSLIGPGLAFLSIAGLATAASTIAASAATVILTDSSYSDVTATPSFNNTTGGTVTAAACSTCGAGGVPGLELIFDYTNATAVGSGHTSDAGLIDNVLTYNPSVQGAIATLNASFQKDILLTGLSSSQFGFIQSTLRLVIEQDNSYYLDTAAISPSWFCTSTNCSSGFISFSISGQTALSFDLFDFTTNTVTASQHPNFSGAAMLFGVESQAPGFGGARPNLGIGQTGTVIYDPLVITVNQTPLPAALPLFASGLGAMGLFGWRRKWKATIAAA